MNGWSHVVRHMYQFAPGVLVVTVLATIWVVLARPLIETAGLWFLIYLLCASTAMTILGGRGKLFAVRGRNAMRCSACDGRLAITHLKCSKCGRPVGPPDG